ncbi:MAG TPA: DUF2905 domain-containing protein [Pedobacter sp.]|jgi:H+/Cl- antiporter ClcA
MNGNAGKWVIIAGFIIVAIGVIIYFFHTKLHWIGNLPGDIKIERENFRFYFPLTTMLLVSLLINVVIRIVKWLN